MPENPISCQLCHSTNVEAKEKGFDQDSAAVGAVLLGGVGMLIAGNAKRWMVIIHCLDCKHQFNHNLALGLDYKSFKTKFYTLYDNKDYEQAESLYASYQAEQELDLLDIHTVYNNLKIEDKKSMRTNLMFAAFAIILIIAFIIVHL